MHSQYQQHTVAGDGIKRMLKGESEYRIMTAQAQTVWTNTDRYDVM